MYYNVIHVFLVIGKYRPEHFGTVIELSVEGRRRTEEEVVERD